MYIDCYNKLYFYIYHNLAFFVYDRYILEFVQSSEAEEPKERPALP